MNVLDELDRLERGATAAQWLTLPNPRLVVAGDIEGPIVVRVEREDDRGITLPQEANAALIALARNHLRALIEVARAAERWNESQYDHERMDDLVDALALLTEPEDSPSPEATE